MIPKLRFPNFSDEWQSRMLGDIVKFSRGGSISKNDLKSSGSYKAIHYGELFTKYGEVITNIDSRTDVDDGVDSEIGDILMPTSDVTPQGLARASVMQEEGVKLGGDINILKPNNDIDSIFLSYTINSQKRKIMRIVSGITVRHIYSSDLAGISYVLPIKKDEQKKITEFLTAVDGRVEKSEKKLKLLQQYKKCIMQKIFNLQIRFKSENGELYTDWSEHKAGELFTNTSNRQHNGDLPVLSVTQNCGIVRRDSLNRKINQSDAGLQNYKIIKPNDFVISLRSFQGGIEKSDVLGISSPAYTVLRGDERTAPRFFKHYFKREQFISKLNSTVIGIRDGKQISYEPFSTLKLPIPSVEEQQKIAAFLDALDDKIKAEQAQITAAKQWKKGLLQRMFV